MPTKDAAQILVALLGEERAAELLGGLSVRTLQRWRQEGRGPRFVRVGRLIRYRQEDLAAFTEAGLRAGTNEAA